MKVGFLNDFSLSDFQGGATLSNELMIIKGKELGYQIDEYTPKIDEYTPKTLEPRLMNLLSSYDLLILSNINSFPTEVIEWIIKNTKYIKYEHDYSFCKYRSAQCEEKCKGKLCIPAKIFVDLYSNSLLNIFFSPLQLDIYRKFFGETMRDSIVIPAPMEKDKFYPDKNVQHDAYLFAGMIATHKGIHQILDFADSNKKKIFHFAGKPINKDAMERIKKNHIYLGEIPHNEMPRLLRKYKYFIINPMMPETYGLSILEAVASGCSIIRFPKSHQTGLESYNKNPILMIKESIDAPNKFWQEVEKII